MTFEKWVTESEEYGGRGNYPDKFEYSSNEWDYIYEDYIEETGGDND